MRQCGVPGDSRDSILNHFMLKFGNPEAEIDRFIKRVRALVAATPGWLKEKWRRRSVAQLDQAVSYVGAAIGIAWFFALLFTHFKVITQPGPQEFNEPAIWNTTWLLEHGRNPYTIAELPGSAYCFTPLYNYVVLAFAPLFGIDYPGHRMVVLIFLLGALWLMLRGMQRAGASLGIAMLSVVFYYWMSLGNIEITARPDTMALFFFLLGILVPWQRGYTLGSSIFGLLCIVVAFNAKSYFILGGCATLLIHFMGRDKREACWLGLGFFALIGLTFAVSCYLFPYLYIVTVIVQRGGAAVNDRDDISLMHTIMLFQRGWPYFVLMGVGLAAWLSRRFGAWLERRRVGQRAPAFAVGEMRFLGFGTVFIIFLTIVYFYMGRNGGAYFTYHLHLLFPLMFVLGSYGIRGPWMRVMAGIVMIFFFQAWVELPQVADSAPPYRRLERLIFDTHSEVLGIASTTDIFARDNRPVLHDGNTMFMGFAFANDRALHDEKVGALSKKFDVMEADVNAKVAARAYGLVLTEFDQPYFCSPQLLQKNYDKVEQIDYFTYFGHSPVRLWRPKPKLPETPAAP
ncbi:MAG: hypothetical protein JWM32_620 [Verrucomicrobia bacterium]|nr:hypothetical protein [Verrucomicrobiota bacterium]